MKERKHEGNHQRRLEKELLSRSLVNWEVCLEEAGFVLCRILKEKVPEIPSCIYEFCLTLENKKMLQLLSPRPHHPLLHQTLASSHTGIMCLSLKALGFLNLRRDE